MQPDQLGNCHDPSNTPRWTLIIIIHLSPPEPRCAIFPSITHLRLPAQTQAFPPYYPVMNRLFGSKAAKPKPSLNDAIASTESRADGVEVKIRKLDAELARYRDQMKKMRDGPGKTAIQQRALRVLKQKRLYENQLAQLQQQSYNMEQATMTTENLRNTMATFDAMQTANKEMRKTYGKIDLDKIESMQDEMEDLIEAANEVQETLGRSYGVPDEVDEEDLQAELDALADDLDAEDVGADAVPSYLQSNQELPDFVDELPNHAQAEGANAEHGEALRAA
ncbi:hypothetical protein PaG_01254 [Moesziomyces aphidis]|nr:hypothetical protein PaG_01254 [Moesziomyces aphidis]